MRSFSAGLVHTASFDFYCYSLTFWAVMKCGIPMCLYPCLDEGFCMDSSTEGARRHGRIDSFTDEPTVQWCRWAGETWRTLTPGRRSDVQEKSPTFMENSRIITVLGMNTMQHDIYICSTCLHRINKYIYIYAVYIYTFLSHFCTHIICFIQTNHGFMFFQNDLT